MVDKRDEYYQPWLRDPTPPADVAGEGLAKPRDEPPLGIDIARYDAKEPVKPASPDRSDALKSGVRNLWSTTRKGTAAFADWTIALGKRADVPARVEAMEIPRRTRDALQKGARWTKHAAQLAGQGSASAGRAAARTGGQVWTRLALGKRVAQLSNEAGRGLGAVADRTRAGLETVAEAAKESVGGAAQKLRPPAPASPAPPPSGLEQLLASEKAEAAATKRPAAPDLPLFAGDIAPPIAPRDKPAVLREGDDRAPHVSPPATGLDPKRAAASSPPRGQGSAMQAMSTPMWFIGGAAAITLLAGGYWLGGRFGGGLDKQEVEAVVADYIRANPQLIPEALEAQRDQQLAQAIDAIRPALEKPYAGAWAGNADGDVTLVVFTDYACGFCRASVPDVDRLLRDDKRLKVVFRELPIIAPQSRDAALMALAAARQGKYDAFHHAMFAASSLEPSAIAAAAERSGVVTDGSADATANEALFQRELDSNLAIATQLQLNATPTWVVGDQLFQGQIGYDALRSAIAKTRAKS